MDVFSSPAKEVFRDIEYSTETEEARVGPWWLLVVLFEGFVDSTERNGKTKNPLRMALLPTRNWVP